MENVISGLVVSLLTQGAKKAESIPIGTDQKGRIRLLAGALSVIAALVMAYLNGHLSTSEYLPILSDAVSNYIMSVIAYHGVIR